MILINSFCSKANKIFLTFSLLFIIRKQSPKWRLNPKFYSPGKSFSCTISVAISSPVRVKLLIGNGDRIHSNITYLFSISSFYTVVEFHTILRQYWDFTEKLINRGDAFIFCRIHCKAHSNGIYAHQHMLIFARFGTPTWRIPKYRKVSDVTSKPRVDRYLLLVLHQTSSSISSAVLL